MDYLPDIHKQNTLY